MTKLNDGSFVSNIDRGINQKDNTIECECCICKTSLNSIPFFPRSSYKCERRHFDNCKRYLQMEIQDAPIESYPISNSYSSNELVPNFLLCSTCFDSAEKISQINDQLTELEKELRKAIQLFKNELKNVRNFSITAGEISTENKQLEDDEISAKEERSVSPLADQNCESSLEVDEFLKSNYMASQNTNTPEYSNSPENVSNEPDRCPSEGTVKVEMDKMACVSDSTCKEDIDSVNEEHISHRLQNLRTTRRKLASRAAHSFEEGRIKEELEGHSDHDSNYSFSRTDEECSEDSSDYDFRPGRSSSKRKCKQVSQRPEGKSTIAKRSICPKKKSKRKCIIQKPERRKKLSVLKKDSSKSVDSKMNSSNKSYTEKGEGTVIKSRSRKGEKKFQCDICQMVFSTNSRMRCHQKTHNVNPYYQCEFCGRSYRHNSFNAFKDHMRSHSGEKPFKCSTCNESFRTRSLMDSHKKVHIDACNFSCEHCGKSYKLLRQLRGHQKTHIDGQYICKDCGKCYKRKDCLKVHRRGAHSGQRFTCDECGSTFSQRYSLTLHIKRLHKNELIFECEVCGKHLSSLVRKQTHMRTHTGEKPFVCQVEACGQRFGNKDSFDAHVRSHTGEKFECNICGKKFDRKQYLKWHFRTHTGEKPTKRKRTLGMEPKVDGSVEVQFQVASEPIVVILNNFPSDVNAGTEENIEKLETG